ncbi:glucose-1-phosphate thymidylyltransferase [Nocardiopsis halotolerans]|uniref:glucose-1-phosphate thymidylyltransferase n=1 Tax=Nocardiopsis halotolerans TaxID=124252 RepID=UPI000347E94B|nr:glucose-1-phosphate thymidylyltransferase [Nocardiopsis halotolerans]
MKALVLAGGTGSRMRPFSHTTAKQLLPVANEPVLFHVLEAVALSGVKDVGVVVGATSGQIREAVGDGSRFGVSVTYLDQREPLGIGHAVHISRGFLGDEDFLLFLGDNYLEKGLIDFVSRAGQSGFDANLLVHGVTDPSRFGVAEIDGHGRVVRVEEKPPNPRSDLALVGVYAFTPAVHEAVRSVPVSSRGELEITDALQWMIDQGLPVGAEPVTGAWCDVGDVDDLLGANRVALGATRGLMEGDIDSESTVVGPVHVAEGAVVRRSHLHGPAVIGPGAVIDDSTVEGFTSIGAGCGIRGSRVGASVVMAEASVERVNALTGSFLGRGAVVSGPSTGGGGHRLVLGDHSRVWLAS